ncbi:MAG: hypothetical protein HOL85_07560 [Rhodospirillaceae bacterium]|jgi:signal transduction histidine kinase|nr:hypothetical protein [Rhodospirillaceae bacterium]
MQEHGTNSSTIETNHLSEWILSAGVAVLYLTAAWAYTRADLALNLGASQLSIANAVLLALLSLAPFKAWPRHLTAMTGAYLLGTVALIDDGFSGPAIYLVASVLQVAPAAYYLRRYIIGKYEIDSLHGMLWIIAAGAALGPLLGTATILASSVLQANMGTSLGWVIARDWWLTAASSSILIAPTILVLKFRFNELVALRHRPRAYEALALLLTSTAAEVIIFSTPSSESFTISLPYLLLPFLIWGATRFPLPAVAAGMLLLGSLATLHTGMGLGPFVRLEEATGQSLQNLQVFLITAAVTGLVISCALTDQRRIARDLVQVTDEAVRAAKAKDQFLASMSHELRTPLNSIIGFSEFMRVGAAGKIGEARFNEYLEDINRSAKYLLGLIEQVLDITRLGDAQPALSEEWLDLKRIATDCKNMATPKAQAREIEIKIELPEHLPALRADRVRVTEVLTNLIANAINFSDEGGHITISADHRSGGELAVSVIDEGAGIEAKDLDVIRQKFARVKSAYVRDRGGLGLGLAISEAILQAHGAHLEIESTPGKGSNFTFVFPAARVVDLTS